MYILMFTMSRPAKTVSSIPGQARNALIKVGSDLRVARERRGESLRVWALRLGVSVPTLRRMEAGDPTVGVSCYAVAFFLIGKTREFANIADPSLDQQALSMEILRASRKSVK